MTRSITIVNSSNWDGEDYLVRQRQAHPGGDELNDYPWNEMTLKPGENITLCPEGTDFEFMPTDSKIPEPFNLNGEQVFPIVLSYVGQLPDQMRRGQG